MGDENKNLAAFPVPDGAGYHSHGMTLRDYFAAAALQGMLANDDESCAEEAEAAEQSTQDYLAEVAYQYADAMLKARNAA